MKHVSSYLTEALAPRKPVLKKDSQGVDLDESSGYCYHVSWAQVSTQIKLIGFVVHLAEKDWADSHVLHTFNITVCEHFGWNPYS